MKALNMRPNNTSGFLFTFCGLDGSGKTTMLTRLEKELSNKYKIFKTKQPTNAVRESDIFRTYMQVLTITKMLATINSKRKFLI